MRAPFISPPAPPPAARRKTRCAFAPNGLKLRAVTLTAKDKICFSPRTSCHPSECVFAQDYFDKRREALREALNLQALDRGNH